jgi:hypothetical protein
MSTTVDQAFIKQFEAEVHEAYQRMGSKFRGTVRTKNGVKGASTTFQKVGKGTASTKARHGKVPVMNIDHTPVLCTLEDLYAGDWVDRLDELKINIDERQVTSNAGAYALGRATDELIITAMATSTTAAATTAGTLTKAKAFEAFDLLNGFDVPDDGNRWGAVGPKQWSALLNLAEFTSSDYVGDQFPFLQGTQARRWLGINWFYHSGLPLSTTDRTCFVYHNSAVGHAIGQDVMADITWHGDRAAHFINNMMSQGAALIDLQGVVKVTCSEA